MGLVRGRLKQVYQLFESQKIVGVLALTAILIWLAVFSLPDRKLHIFVFDVGQGDSIFIRTPKNYKILIDGGPDERVLERLSSVLPFYDKSLDLVILTHPHADHINGLTEVLKVYKVTKVLYNLVPYQSSEYQRFKDQVRAQNIDKRLFTVGDKIELTDGVTLSCFWPQRQETFAELIDVNFASIVFRLDFGEFSALLTGDAEFGKIWELEKIKWEPVEFLKVPHQGSREATTQKVLEELKPQLAVISVGPNKFGHPSQSVIGLLEAVGAKVLRTDQHGTVEVISDGKRWFYRVEK